MKKVITCAQVYIIMKRIVSIIISVLLSVLAAGQSVYVADFKPEASGASDDLESVSVTDASGNI